MLETTVPGIPLTFQLASFQQQDTRRATHSTMFSKTLLGLLAGVVATAASADATGLPVFFFHGSTGNHTNGDMIGNNLKAAGRTYVALDFCERACSVQTSLVDQVQLAIKQIRGVISQSPATYANGYHFIGHSTGGVLARGVVEEMDDHNVHSLVSLAGDGNGNFYGPQPSDLGSPLQVLLQLLGPFAIQPTDFNFTKYQVDPSTYNGKFQRDFMEFVLTRADLQKQNAVVQSQVPPVKYSATDFLKVNPFYPKINNLEVCGTDAVCTANQMRRKANFVRLKALQLFASPGDDLQVPWQTSLLSKYSKVDTVDEIETKFSTLTMLPAQETEEYMQDLYGLRTLDQAGGLFFHPIPGIGHNCWLFDYVPIGKTDVCLFQPNFEKNVLPVLV
jgi:palmitoyl-protein thioesterase